MDDLPTLRAEGWLECGRILQFLEIVLVGAVPHVHLGLETFAAFLAVLPTTGMAFVIVVTAQCVAVMIAVAGIRCIRKENVIAFVVANPIVATWRARQRFGGRAAQTTPGLIGACHGWCAS